MTFIAHASGKISDSTKSSKCSQREILPMFSFDIISLPGIRRRKLPHATAFRCRHMDGSMS